MNRSAGDVADVPPGVVTVTFTVPVPAGLLAVIVVSLTTVKLVAAVVPKSTAVAPVKPLPVIVTNVPPAAGPAVGLRPVTVGATAYSELIGGRRGRRAARRGHGHVHVPLPAGLSAVIVAVADHGQVRRRGRAEVNRVAPVKPVPVIVTIVPPTCGPTVGLRPETAARRRK